MGNTENKINLGYMLVGVGTGMAFGYLLYDMVKGSHGSEKHKEKKIKKRRKKKHNK